MRLPGVDDLLAGARVVALPMSTRFRGLSVRETMLIRSTVDGVESWGEFAAFPEYDDAESAPWLASAIEQAWGLWPTPSERPVFRDTVPVNATRFPSTRHSPPSPLGRFPRCLNVSVSFAR